MGEVSKPSPSIDMQSIEMMSASATTKLATNENSLHKNPGENQNCESFKNARSYLEYEVKQEEYSTIEHFRREFPRQ